MQGRVLGALVASLAMVGAGTVATRSSAAEKPKRRDFPFAMPQAAHLGVTLDDVGAEDVARLGLSAERGAIVKGVRAGTPAAEAGLREGDVIVTFQGETVQSAAQLARLVAETPPGRSVEMTLRRDGAEMTLRATLDGRGFPGGFGMEPPDLADSALPPDFDVEALAG